MKLAPIAITASIFVSLCVSAPEANAQGGRGAYQFLEIPTSSRVFGLGGCNISMIDTDVTLSQQNPALLGAEIGSSLGVSYMHYMGSANFAGARYGHSSGERGAWAAGIRYLNYGEIAGYDHTGASTGSFTPVDMVGEGTYSHDFNDRLRGGINLKLIYSNYERYTSIALAADLGINYYDPDHDLSLSAVLSNMGGQLKRFEDKYDHLPFDVQLGVTKGLGESFSVSVTAWHLTDFSRKILRNFVFGAEYMPTDRFYIDLGYNYRTRSDMSNYQRNIFSGFSAGVGIRASAFAVGAAYAMPHKGASTVLLNLSLDISEL